MKLSKHARQRIEERFGPEYYKLVRRKIEKGDYFNLPDCYQNHASLVEVNNKGIVALRNNNIIITVNTVPLYLERNKHVMEDPLLMKRLSKYCGFEVGVNL